MSLFWTYFFFGNLISIWFLTFFRTFFTFSLDVSHTKKKIYLISIWWVQTFSSLIKWKVCSEKRHQICKRWYIIRTTRTVQLVGMEKRCVCANNGPWLAGFWQDMGPTTSKTTFAWWHNVHTKVDGDNVHYNVRPSNFQPITARYLHTHIVFPFSSKQQRKQQRLPPPISWPVVEMVVRHSPWREALWLMMMSGSGTGQRDFFLHWYR